jgi:hypothetical protein
VADSVEIVEVEEIPLAYLPETPLHPRQSGRLAGAGLADMWHITADDVEAIAIGAGILGTGAVETRTQLADEDAAAKAAAA